MVLFNPHFIFTWLIINLLVEYILVNPLFFNLFHNYHNDTGNESAIWNYQNHLRLDTLKNDPEVPQSRMLHCVCKVRKHKMEWLVFIFTFYVYINVFLNVCLCVSYVPDAQGDQKRALNPLGLELQGDETWTMVLWKSS